MHPNRLIGRIKPSITCPKGVPEVSTFPKTQQCIESARHILLAWRLPHIESILQHTFYVNN